MTSKNSPSDLSSRASGIPLREQVQEYIDELARGVWTTPEPQVVLAVFRECRDALLRAEEQQRQLQEENTRLLENERLVRLGLANMRLDLEDQL